MTREKAVSTAILFLEQHAKAGNDEAAEALGPLYGIQRSLIKEVTGKEERKARRRRRLEALRQKRTEDYQQ